MRMRSMPVPAALLFLVLVPAPAMALPDCAGGVIATATHVARIGKGGTLILADGRTARLEGIRLPLYDGGPPALARRALAVLGTLAMARPLILAAQPPQKDRYGRLRVQAFGVAWLQVALLKRGLARVEIAPDRGGCSAALYRAERQAREAGAGLWALHRFALRAPETITAADAGTFQIIEGRLVDAERHDGRIYLDFNRDRRGFSAIVVSPDTRAFRHFDPPLATLGGRRVRVRGVVEMDGPRPRIALSNPTQIEMLP